MKLEHMQLMSMMEKRFQQKGEYFTVRELKKYATDNGIKLGTDKAGELINNVKKTHSKDSEQLFEAVCALLHKSSSEIKKEIQKYALEEPLKNMTKHQLIVGLCALSYYKYTEIEAKTRADIQKELSEARKRVTSAMARVQFGVYDGEISTTPAENSN